MLSSIAKRIHPKVCKEVISFLDGPTNYFSATMWLNATDSDFFYTSAQCSRGA
jgi:hypothetical protein